MHKNSAIGLRKFKDSQGARNRTQTPHIVAIVSCELREKESARAMRHICPCLPIIIYINMNYMECNVPFLLLWLSLPPLTYCAWMVKNVQTWLLINVKHSLSFSLATKSNFLGPTQIKFKIQIKGKKTTTELVAFVFL